MLRPSFTDKVGRWSDEFGMSSLLQRSHPKLILSLFAQTKAAVRTLDCARDPFDACWMKTITGVRVDGGQKTVKVLGRMDGCSKLDYSKEVKLCSFLAFPMLKLMSSYFPQLVVLS